MADSGTPVATVAVTPAAESGAAAGLNSEKPAEAPAETMAAVPAVASEAAALSVEATPAGEKDSSAPVAEEAAEEPAATFADAVQHDEVEGVSAKPGAEPVFDASVPVSEVGPAVVGTMEVSTSEAAGGEDDMSKDRGKNGKSNWHQIRTGSAAAGTHDAVEAAKQAEPAEEAPKAMAAAAAAESGAASAASSDPNAIASIVDSVLADLRPKIVEEIAKKLAKRD